MGRPARSTAVSSRRISKEEKQKRQEIENQLKGDSAELKPPKWLSTTQKKIFKMIVNQLQESNILGNLDIYLLSNTAVTIDRLQQIEQGINNDTSLLTNSAWMATQNKYTQQFFKCCNELCLSPQSRAKLASINLQAESDKSNPLLNALADDDDDG